MKFHVIITDALINSIRCRGGLKLALIHLLRDLPVVMIMDDTCTHVHRIKILFNHGLLSY